MIIMGIDPSSTATGYGLIRQRADGWSVVQHGCIRTGGKVSIAEKLGQLYSGLMQVIGEYQPDMVVIERGFSGKNPRTAMVMGQVLGVSLLAASNAALPVSEYAPREVKLAVTGSGSASKEQVQYMVGQLLGIVEADLPLDASDALAVALCHANRLSISEF
jgi:crossover junction endodeoxyribonuclease RuvC